MNMLDIVGSMARTAVREKKDDRSDDGSHSSETNATYQPQHGDDEICQHSLDYSQQSNDQGNGWRSDAVHDTKD